MLAVYYAVLNVFVGIVVLIIGIMTLRAFIIARIIAKRIRLFTAEYERQLNDPTVDKNEDWHLGWGFASQYEQGYTKYIKDVDSVNFRKWRYKDFYPNPPQRAVRTDDDSSSNGDYVEKPTIQ